ncbi:uncharacterized protein OCT59_015934 [Rhizophagus irregularis]|uniref:uncharacterized protein n=1 Tax=Rhizophagus irregularis TaxID=588596 RepID=UPI00331946B4|nr:hypothetical protein OCT59_015934 [Rhizophagus irregularis]
MIYYLILHSCGLFHLLPFRPSPSLSFFPFPFILPFLSTFSSRLFSASFSLKYPVPSALDFLVGFLGVGRHLASVFFFVGWYLAVDQHLGMNQSWWSQNRTLKTCRRNISDIRKLTDVDRKMSKDFKDAGLNTNQTLRTHRSTDFKSASLDYKEGNSFLRGLESALGLEYVIWHPVLLALNFGSWLLGFLQLDFLTLISSAFWNKLVPLLSFYSVHLTCNTIRGSWIGYMGFEGVLHFVI